MNTTHTYLIQAVLLLLQIGNALTDVVPPKWKAVVLGFIGLLQIAQARMAHNWNPDGTPAAQAFIKKAAVLLIACLLGAAMANAQTAPSTPPPSIETLFSVGTQVTAVKLAGQTSPGTDAFGEFAITNKITLRADNILTSAPCPLCGAGSAQIYLVKVKPMLPLDSLFAKTNLPKKTFLAYASVGPGVMRIVPPTGSAVQKIAFEAGGGFNYDPTGSGRFTINLFDVNYLNSSAACQVPGAPAKCGPHNVRYSIGIDIGLWHKTQ